jgi:hypothetical protein
MTPTLFFSMAQKTYGEMTTSSTNFSGKTGYLPAEN